MSKHKITTFAAEKWQLARLWWEWSIAAVLPASPNAASRLTRAGPPTAEKLLEMACVYILKSLTNGKTYTGSSRKNDAESRIKRHNAGLVRSTKSGIAWELIHHEIFEDYTSARKRELFLKSGKGREWIKENFRS